MGRHQARWLGLRDRPIATESFAAASGTPTDPLASQNGAQASRAAIQRRQQAVERVNRLAQRDCVAEIACAGVAVDRQRHPERRCRHGRHPTSLEVGVS